MTIGQVIFWAFLITVLVISILANHIDDIDRHIPDDWKN